MCSNIRYPDTSHHKYFPPRTHPPNPDISQPGHFTTRTFHNPDISQPGHFTTRTFPTRTFHNPDISQPGHFTTRTFHNPDISQPGHFQPGHFTTRTFPPISQPGHFTTRTFPRTFHNPDTQPGHFPRTHNPDISQPGHFPHPDTFPPRTFPTTDVSHFPPPLVKHFPPQKYMFQLELVKVNGSTRIGQQELERITDQRPTRIGALVNILTAVM